MACISATQKAASWTLELAHIRTDGDTQGRAALDEAVVAEYAALMAEGVQFPPVRVWFDGQAYWLADGFHRVNAARRASLNEIAVELHSGTLDDARWDSFRANATNGLRRTKEDLEIVIQRALAHQQATGLSTNRLAQHLGIPEPTLRRWKRKSNPTSSAGDVGLRLATRNGSVYTIEIQKIGRSSALVATRIPLRPGHRLAKELDELRLLSIDGRTSRIVNLLDKWFVGLIGPKEISENLRRIWPSSNG